MSRIDSEAAEWVSRMSGCRDAETEAAFRAWHDADPRHAGAYLRAEAAWVLLDRAQVLTHGGGEAMPAPLLRTRTPSGPTRRAVLMGAVAASVAVVAGIGAVLATRVSFTTRRGELRNIPLHDRSLAAVNTDSRIDVAMSDTARKIELVKGEAWFEVARNPKAPFTVSAGDIRVRAIGTAFGVRRHAGGADVLVTEGTVETWSIRDPERRTRLTAGNRAFIASASETVQVSFQPDEVERRLAWREREIILREESLADAAAEFNRYNEQQIIIADEALGDMTLVGGFQVDQPEAFARAVHAALDAPVSIRHDRIIIGTPSAS